MNVSLGELLGLVADLLAMAGVDGFRETSRQLIRRMAKEAERRRVRRKSGRNRPRSSTCGQYRDGGRSGGAPRVTVTVRPPK